MELSVNQRVLSANDEIASQIRQRLRGTGCFTANIISSPGAGKTTLLERTASLLKNRYPDLRWAAIEGDIATDLDASRVARHGVPAVQINTRGDCHLDARMVFDALSRLDAQAPLASLDLLLIENVGNLVCPTEYDLGEDAKVVVASIAEGDDKPAKYPATFAKASALVVNKIDLMPYVDCDVERLIRDATTINPRLTVMRVSCRTGEGLEAWIDWLADGVTAAKSRVSEG